MNRDEILRMAREVADPETEDPVSNGYATLTLDELERFYHLARAAGEQAEREACAKELEAIADRIPVEQREGFVYKTVIECVAAIRARGEKK